MRYIKRSLEKNILDLSEDYSCILLIGPRQVGKTTMLEHLMEGTDRNRVSLDNVENRRLAKKDPELFLELLILCGSRRNLLPEGLQSSICQRCRSLKCTGTGRQHRFL